MLRSVSIPHVIWALILVAPVSIRAAEESVDTLLNQAQVLLSKGRPQDALQQVNQAQKLAPQNAQVYYVRGRIQDAIRRFDAALADFNEVIKLEPRAIEVYQHRGGVHFKLGHFAESIADFDRVLEKMPAQIPHHWQRGISYYYAGRYEDGRKQFELHQTVNSNDVENAVWHFLCLARSQNFDRARESLIDIKGDARVPLMKIHALYKGTATPEEVVAEARAGDPPVRELNHRLFYAYLYLGLYFDVRGDKRKALENMQRAAETYSVDHYMGDVARVHWARLRAELSPK